MPLINVSEQELLVLQSIRTNIPGATAIAPGAHQPISQRRAKDSKETLMRRADQLLAKHHPDIVFYLNQL